MNHLLSKIRRLGKSDSTPDQSNAQSVMQTMGYLDEPSAKSPETDEQGRIAVLHRLVDLPDNDTIHQRLLDPLPGARRDERFLEYMDEILFPAVLTEFDRYRRESDWYVTYQRAFIQDIASVLMAPMIQLLQQTTAVGVIVLVPTHFPKWLAALVDDDQAKAEILQHDQWFTNWLIAQELGRAAA